MAPTKKRKSKRTTQKRRRRSTNSATNGSRVKQYHHKGQTRVNTPPIGLVNPKTDIDKEHGTYHYSPHLDPILNWTGRYEFEDLSVPTVSLHMHERIDPATIIDKIMKKETHRQTLLAHFELKENNPPFDKAIQFYKHSHGWSNRFIIGDSLLVMNSLLKKEDLMGKIQMIYIDPPYGIEYGSNFQPFVCKMQVKDKNDDDLAHTPETIRAFRDTWELGIHSYLSYMRDRLILARELLTESGSCAVQISDENLHYIRMVMDEIFDAKNFVGLIPFRKTTSSTSKRTSMVCDYIVWYAKDINQLKHNKIYEEKSLPINDPNYKYVELKDGTRRSMTKSERQNPLTIPADARIYRLDNLRSSGKSKDDDTFVFDGEKFNPGPNLHWKVTLEGMNNLAKKNRLVKHGNILQYVRYFNDFSHIELTNMWVDTTSGGFENTIYVVQTTAKVIRRFLLMTTEPGDLVLDPTCGSGTTAYVAEQYGRRWITCDTQRVAITLAKRRLMTSNFKYYQLQHAEQGVGSGFSFTEPNGISLQKTPSSVAYNRIPEQIILYDKPDEVKGKTRVSGPFTVESVPSPTAASIDAMYNKTNENIESDKENTRQEEWRDLIKRSGVKGRDGQRIEFIDVKPHPTSKWLHAIAKTNEPEPKIVTISFGPPYASLGPRQVESALQESRKLRDRPDMVLFAAMQFDPEAARIIDDLDWPGISVLKIQMSSDMLVGNLKRGEPHTDSFMLIGQPDARIKKTKDNKYQVQVLGFDYYDAKSGEIESGGASKIVIWMLDTDYDGRSMYPQQVFFPMAKEKGGYWNKIARSLSDHVDWDLIGAYTKTKSLEFELGDHKRVAIKIIDDRGVELLQILEPSEN